MWKYSIDNQCSWIHVGAKILYYSNIHTVTKLVPAYLQSCDYDDAFLINTDEDDIGHPYWICNCKSCPYWNGMMYPYTKVKE